MGDEEEDFDIPQQYGQQNQQIVPPEQLFGSEMYQHKTRLYTTEAERIREQWSDGHFTARCNSAFLAGYAELFDRSHILAKVKDTDMMIIECDLMHDRMKFAARKSDRNNRLFDVNYHGGIHLYGVLATRAVDAWEAEHQHKVTTENRQESTVRHVMPKQKRGFLGFGGGK
jgi:hypothetical protein